jgi:hypothetical protein
MTHAATDDWGRRRVKRRTIMVGIYSHKKLPCLSNLAPLIEPSTISTVVGPESQSNLVLMFNIKPIIL